MSVSLDPRPATESAAAPAGIGFRPDVEGVRAVAVGSVVLGHAGAPFFGGGYVGVDVFFVISGFLITSLLLRERADTGRISIRGFYARRVTRLLPASALVVVATVAASWLWLPATRFASIVGDALASACYLVNYRLAITGTDYLNADAAPSPLQHFWSLAVEEQFYLVWPVLLIALTAVWRRRGSVRRRPIAAVLAGIVAVSLAISVAQTSASAPWAYFGTQTRAWELAAGALVAVAARRLSAIRAGGAAALTWAGLAAIAASVLLYGDATAYPGYAAALPVAGAAAVIAGGCARPSRGAGLLLGVGVFQYVGRISYGYYLWHWPFLMIGPAALGIAASTKLSLVLAVAALVPTVLSFHLVENPVRRRAILRQRPWRGIGLGAALSAGTAAIAVAALVFPPPLAGSGIAADTTAAVSRADDPADRLAGLLDRAVATSTVPANLAPALDAAAGDRPKIYDVNCHVDPEDVAAPGPCVYGDPKGDKRVALIGDSHAAQWFPALDAIAKQRGWRLYSRTKGFCSAPTVTVYNRTFKRDYTECDRWRDAMLDEVAKLRPDMVIMASSDGDDDEPVHTRHPDRAWVRGWIDAYRRASTAGTAMVHISDTPWARTRIPECLSTHIETVRSCTQTTDDAVRRPGRRRAVVDALKPLGVKEIDPLPWFCSAGGGCPVIVGNLLVYRDGHHMSTNYARMLIPLLRKELPRI